MPIAHRESLPVVWLLAFLGHYLNGSCFTFWKDQEALECILILAEAMRKLWRWRRMLLDFEFDIFHCLRMKHQVADVLLHHKTRGEDHILFESKVSVHTIPQKSFPCAPCTETSEFSIFEKPKGTFVPLHTRIRHDGFQHWQ